MVVAMHVAFLPFLSSPHFLGPSDQNVVQGLYRAHHNPQIGMRMFEYSVLNIMEGDSTFGLPGPHVVSIFPRHY